MKTARKEAIETMTERAAEAVRRAGDAGVVPRGGWLRAMRAAKSASPSELAAKLGCARQAWAQFEASEAREAISLISLRRAAAALGCEVAYFVYPRAKRSEAGVVASAPARRGVADHKAVGAGDARTAAPEAGRPAAGWVESPELPTELR